MSNTQLQFEKQGGPKVFHKGLVLVAAPFFIELALIFSLALVLVESDKESIRETKYRRCAAIGAKLISLSNDCIVSVFGCFQGDPKIFAKIYDTNIEKIHQKEAQLTEVAGNDKLAAKAASQLIATLQDFQPVLDKLIQPAKEGKRIVEIAETLNDIKDEFDRLRDQAMARMSQVSKLQERIAEQSTKRRERLQLLQHQVLLAGAAANLIAGILLLLYYRKSISNRLRVVMENTKLLADGKPLKAALTGGDEISQLDQAFHSMDRDLKLAAQRESALFENAKDVICVLDRELNFTKVNPACEQFWGYSAESLVGTSVIELIAETSKYKAKQSLHNAIRTGSNSNLELEIKTKRNSYAENLWTTYYSSKELSLYCIVHDISERKQTEKQKQEFITLMSSNLKQPLAAIAMDINKLLGPLKDELSQKAYSRLETVTKNIDRLLLLVSDLLNMAQASSANLQSEKYDTSLKEIVLRSVQDLEGIAQQKKIQFLLDCQADRCYADANRIIQVIVNLGSNAIKFSAEGTVVQISTRDSGNFIELKVTDKGRGIPSTHLRSVFEKFEQVDVTDGKRKAGTGLGLPICKEIIEEHGGEIKVESEGVGSTFSFTLPKDESTYRAVIQTRVSAICDQVEAKHLALTQTQSQQALALPARSAGMNLSLLRKGLILIGVPILFELVFVAGIATVLSQTEKSQLEEQHQRQLASTAYTLLDGYFNLSVVIVRRKSFENWLIYDKICQRMIDAGEKLQQLVKGDKVATAQLAAAQKIHDKVTAIIYTGREVMLTGFTSQKADKTQIDRFALWSYSAALSRRLNKLIDDAEKKEFINPAKQLALRNEQGLLLLAGLAINVLLSLFLAKFLSKDISSRLAIQADNANRLGRDMQLNPVLPGRDEIAQLDRAFHTTAEKLAEARERERAVFDNSRDIICVLDADARFLSVNSACLDTFGSARETLLSSSFLDFVVAAEKNLLENAFKDKLNTIEVQILDQENSTKFLMLSLSRPPGQENIYCIGHDISARKELQQMKQNFLAVVSHDLRSPLSSMLSIAELVESGILGEISKNASTVVHDITEQGTKLIELINDLLDIEKLSAGKLELIIAEVDSKKIVDSLIATLSSKFPRHKFSIEETNKSGTVKLDQDRIIQALVNFANQIVENTPEDITIQIKQITGENSIQWILIDAKHSLSEEQLYSVLNNGKTSILPLALACKIVEAHSGTVNLRSAAAENMLEVSLPL